MTLFNQVSNWINKELLPEPEKEVRVFITYREILEGRKEKVKRILHQQAQENNLERVHRAKCVLNRIEQQKFIIV